MAVASVSAACLAKAVFRLGRRGSLVCSKLTTSVDVIFISKYIKMGLGYV